MTYENQVLNERGKTHGDYAKTAEIAQVLKVVVRGYMEENKAEFSQTQCESLDLICTKVARILSGNPNEPDHWKDIAGYANLVSERL